MRIGFMQAARVMDFLEEAGVVSPARLSEPRSIYADKLGEALSLQHIEQEKA
jgi:DNA segregation ATPase FtsK/SpoIIIE-like protein